VTDNPILHQKTQRAANVQVVARKNWYPQQFQMMIKNDWI